jgi:hypothetical protein
MVMNNTQVHSVGVKIRAKIRANVETRGPVEMIDMGWVGTTLPATGTTASYWNNSASYRDDFASYGDDSAS